MVHSSDYIHTILQPGYGQRIMQFVTREKHHPLVNLKEGLNKLLFPSGELMVICEDSGIFTMALSTFYQYEKYVSVWKHSSTSSTI